MSIRHLKTDELECSLKTLLSTERETQAQFLLHLAEFDRRRGFEAHGYATLWQYCVRVLGLSESQTHYRTESAWLIRRFPIATEFIASGRLCMTNLVQLRNVLTEENCAELLERAVGKSKEEVLRLVASLRPTPVPEATLIRRVPERPTTERLAEREKSVSTLVESTMPAATTTAAPAASSDEVPTPMPRPAAERPEVLPVSDRQYRIRMLVDREFVEMLERAQSALSHRIADGDLRKVLGRGLEMILEAEAKRHDPAAVKARKSSRVADPDSRYIPADLLRQVWERDGGCCVWKTATGICGSTWQLEVDHIVAVALGGKTVLENLRLVCRAHNQMHARKDFGEELIRSKIAGGNFSIS